MRRLLIVSAVLFLVVLASAQEAATDRFQVVVNRMVKAINEADYAGTGRDFAQTMEDFFPLDKRRPFFKNLSTQYGKILKLNEPRLVPPYQAIFVAHCEREMLDITVWLDDKDKIIGLEFLPHKEDTPVPDKHKTKLSLPFKGSWLVFWGGDTKELNLHHEVPNQKFAFDFLGVDKYGRTHRGDGRANEDYFGFGREVLAPADGVVTDVITGVRDNERGSMNPYLALGNAIFIQHRKNEVSVLAHFKKDSIRVKVGDRVKSGQVIGLCGNSGNSSAPHIHYHLQNTPVIQDGAGIKCYFQKVIVINGRKKEPETHYSPVKGEIITAEQ